MTNIVSPAMLGTRVESAESVLWIDWGFVCYLIAGERFNGDVIHVACKIVDDVVQINTVYFPYVHLWEDDRVRRR